MVYFIIQSYVNGLPKIKAETNYESDANNILKKIAIKFIKDMHGKSRIKTAYINKDVLPKEKGYYLIKFDNRIEIWENTIMEGYLYNSNIYEKKMQLSILKYEGKCNIDAISTINNNSNNEDDEDDDELDELDDTLDEEIQELDDVETGLYELEEVEEINKINTLYMTDNEPKIFRNKNRIIPINIEAIFKNDLFQKQLEKSRTWTSVSYEFD